MHEDLLEHRSLFPVLDRSVYLINNSLGAMPQGVTRSLSLFTEGWSTRGVRSWEDSWWQLPQVIGDQIAGLIGAGKGTVSIQPSVTAAEWVAFSCLQPSLSRNRVVYSSINFPSVRYFYQAQKELEIAVVPSTDGVTVPTERMLEAIDESTLLVPISHVLFKSAYIQDVQAIIQKAHSVGAYVILDLYHSGGIIPVDLTAWQADFAVGGVLKWLCGGPGVAFLYVRQDLADQFRPRLTGWLAHERPFDFEPEMSLTRSPYRFMCGTPNIPGLHAAQEGLKIIRQVGVKRIRERSIYLTERIVELARENRFHILSPLDPSQRGGHVSIDFESSERVSRELLKRDYVIDFRPGSGIRIAPHFFNTVGEIESLFEAIRDLKDSLS